MSSDREQLKGRERAAQRESKETAFQVRRTERSQEGEMSPERVLSPVREQKNDLPGYGGNPHLDGRKPSERSSARERRHSLSGEEEREEMKGGDNLS